MLRLRFPDEADHMSLNAGIITLGHPLGTSGTRVTITVLHQLEETQGKYTRCTIRTDVEPDVRNNHRTRSSKKKSREEVMNDPPSQIEPGSGGDDIVDARGLTKDFKRFFCGQEC